MSQLIGRVKIEVNGRRYRTKKGARLMTGGITRTPVTASDGTVHWTEDVEAASCTFSVLHASDIDVTEIHALTGVTINFIADNGIAYVMPNGFSTKPPEINDDGEAPFEFAGDPAIKQ